VRIAVKDVVKVAVIPEGEDLATKNVEIAARTATKFAVRRNFATLNVKSASKIVAMVAAYLEGKGLAIDQVATKVVAKSAAALVCRILATF
jgi:hypothetical protein